LKFEKLTKNKLILFIGQKEIETELLEKRLNREGFLFTKTHFDINFKELFKAIKPDLILIDIDKGEWQSHSVPALIKNELDPSIPIILIIDRNNYDAINQGYKLDVSDFVVKPVNWLIMKTRIHNVIISSQLIYESKKIKQQFIQAQKFADLGNWELSENHSMMICSKGVFDILGLKDYKETIELKQFLKFVHPEDKQDISSLMRQAINRLYPFKRDHRILLDDGTEKIVDHKVSMVWDKIKKKRSVGGTIQDITSRKLSEYLEQDRSRVMEMIVRNESLKSILKELIYIVTRQKAEAGCIIALRRDNKLFNHAVSSSLPEEFLKAIDGQKIGPKSGSGGAGAYTGDFVSASDISKSPMWEEFKDVALAHNLNACHAYPILSSKGEVFGIISIYYEHVCFLKESVNYLLKTASDLASIAIERLKLNKQLLYHARYDNLTGLPNRFYFSERLNDIIQHAERYNEKVALFFIDLDRFKQVNDSLGHKIGDLLLKEVAQRLASLTRKTDILARMGGDEFVQILSKVDERQDAAVAARRLIEEVSKPYDIGGNELYVGASIGICISPDDTRDPMNMQKYADIAMYYAKNTGGGRFQFFTSDMDEEAISRLEIENDLRKALERNEFEVFYQPQFLLEDKKLIGFEALLRWNHPQYGRISPARFIPIAEKTELIIPLGEWVLREACRQNAAWEKKGYGPFRVAVNVSVIQFVNTDFSKIIAKTLKEFNLQPHQLEVEVTESVVIEDIDMVSKKLSEISELGVHTAIDDFGTGYSSMSYIEGLPVNALKIDQSFVRKIGWKDESDEKSKILLESMVQLADNLKLTSIAEGFESEDQYNFLRDIGCKVGQGYYLGLPMSVEDIEFHCQTDLSCVVTD